MLLQKYLVSFASLDLSFQLSYLYTFVRSSVCRMLCQIDISIRMRPCVACTVSITSKHRTSALGAVLHHDQGILQSLGTGLAVILKAGL